jgi:hypothetical protein
VTDFPVWSSAPIEPPGGLSHDLGAEAMEIYGNTSM